MGLTVARTVVRLLAEAGVRRAYAIPGESVVDLLEALQVEPRLNLISARHEAGAAFMADADGKLCGTPAVAVAGSGPGATGMTAAVHTAFQDETPMVVLLGQVPSGDLGEETFQEVDLVRLYAPLAKWTAEATTPDEVPGLLAEALHAVNTGRQGPAVLSVPADFWARPFESVVQRPAEVVVPPGSLERLAGEVARLVDDARYPVIIAGGGVRLARKQLIDAVDHLGLAVYTAFRRQDAFPENHPNYVGHLGHGVPDDQLRALEQADLVLALGTRLDEVTTQRYRYPAYTQPLVMVGGGRPGPRRRGLTFHVDTDVARFLSELRQAAKPRKRNWTVAHQAVKEFMRLPQRGTSGPVHPADVVRSLRQLAPEDTVVTTDAGNFAAFVHRYWCFTQPRTQLGPCNGAMGYAVPAAVAAKLAEPHRTVVAMVGDGGALMTGQEIETAVRHRAPVIVVVFQNGLYGAIAAHQARSHGRLSSVAVGTVDFASWARGLGAAGYTVNDQEELEPALASALMRQRPCVVDVRTDPDVIAPDQRLSTMLRSRLES
ncbi:thiamine pyrophosphate-binding protein [Amycolatopsis sp. YIM 10]|uniref:thiamine pyrophosphate-binding protein n=1 Tax=Amycolatopsis sp. YIM 10 TaxID=2653857 RepID=UPI0012903B15|nr:thiamine pyrophosphate-dependent enzyme [Amycolatopsis sp. YIM 10]QFU94304.1 Putative thiamine pyrophosphate-containing protein YdaP [Amycolatopsis sp. YIM 10]